MKIKVKNIKYYILYIILFFVVLPPKIISAWPELAGINQGLSYISWIICCFVVVCTMCLLLRRKKITNRKLLFWMMCLWGWICLSNLVNKDLGAMKLFFFTFLQNIVLVLVCNLALNTPRKLVFIGSARLYGMVVCMLNLLSQLMYGREGIYHDWTESNQAVYICGNDNSFVFFYLFAMGSMILYDVEKYKRVKCFTLVFNVILIYSMKIADSSNGMVIILAVFAATLFSFKELVKFIKKHYNKIFFVALIFVLWFVVFKGWSSDFVQGITQALLNEAMNLSSRGLIWNTAIDRIGVKPVWGYGTRTSILSGLYTNVGFIKRSAHNTYLQMALYGGIPALLIFVHMIVLSIKRRGPKQGKGEYFSLVIISLYLLAFMFEQEPFYIAFYFFLAVKGYLYSADERLKLCQEEKS